MSFVISKHLYMNDFSLSNEKEAEKICLTFYNHVGKKKKNT